MILTKELGDLVFPLLQSAIQNGMIENIASTNTLSFLHNILDKILITFVQGLEYEMLSSHSSDQRQTFRDVMIH